MTTFSRTFFLVLSALAFTGCSEKKSPSLATAKASVEQIAPEELLKKLRDSYSKLDSYSDNSLLLQRGVHRSMGSVTEVPFTRLSLLYKRPNRYAITYDYGIASTEGRTTYRIACDGSRVRSTASELPDQVHEAIAPKEVTVENFIPEPELRQAILNVALENLFPQLALLVASDSEKPIFPRATEMSLLPEKKIGEEECYRLVLTEPEGSRVLWIDKATLTLRRMEVPIEAQRASMDPAKQFTSFSVDLDFQDVARDPEFDDAAVSVQVPQKGRLVRRFIPPPPAGPLPSLGKPFKEFAFTDANGDKVSLASVKGKICVLDFWATDCAPCREHTPLLEEAYQEFKSAEDVAFFGVSTDPKGLPTETVEKTLKSWGATFPLLRDLEKSSFYDLGVKATPTLMLVSGDGRLQAVRVGPLESAEVLIDKVRQVQAGKDLSDQAREEHQKNLDQYEAILAAATISDSLVPAETPTAKIASQKMPEILRAEELWQTEPADVGNHGEVAVLPTTDGGHHEVAVLDGGKALVCFDTAGKKLTRVDLPKSAGEAAGFLRAAVDAQGSPWFLVSGKGWQRVYLYDKDWRLKLSFPDESHSGVGDAQLIDLKESGSPNMVVGYLGGRGVHAGAISGERLWINRHLDHVMQVAVGPKVGSKLQSLWCTSTRGTVLELSADGKSDKEIVVEGHTMVSVESASEGSTFCGLSLTEPGKYAVVAFNDQGQVTWRYDLPEGEYSYAVANIEPINLPDNKNCHLVAGPDGSLHFLSFDGDLIDRFDYGKPISGLAARSTEAGTLMWVTAGDRLTAWRITAEPTP